MTTKKKVIIGGVILVAILIYLWYKRNASTTVNNTGTVVNPVTGQSSTGYTLSDGTPVPQPVIDWIGTLPSNSKAKAMSSLNTMTQNDLSNLFTVITQYFNTGIPVKSNPTANQYWVNYVTKFQITNPATGQLY